MSFSNFTPEIANTGAGEVFSKDALIQFASIKFEEGLKAGLFAKLDTGSLDNLDGSVTPVIAGVVTKDVTSTLEEAGTYTAQYHSSVDYVRSGLVTVTVKAGESPVQFGAVFASNAGDANDGMALIAAGEATGAEFIREVSTNVWLVRLK